MTLAYFLALAYIFASKSIAMTTTTADERNAGATAMIEMFIENEMSLDRIQIIRAVK